MFVIDPKPFQARLDETTSDLAIRQAELKLAETTLKRKEGALKDKAISEVEAIEARAQRDKAAAAVEAARAAVETARLDLSYTKIHAPVSGRIGRNLLRIGLQQTDLEFVAVSDVADLESLAYLFAHGTIEGAYPEPVAAEGHSLRRSVPVRPRCRGCARRAAWRGP